MHAHMPAGNEKRLAGPLNVLRTSNAHNDRAPGPSGGPEALGNATASSTAMEVSAGHPTVAPVGVEEFRDVMRNLAGGVAILATGHPGKRRGLTITALSSVSAEPPCLLACVNTASASHDAVLRNGCFSINLLASCHEQLAMRFAGHGGHRGEERFEGWDWTTALTGAPILASALAAMDCELISHQRIGTHGLFVGVIAAVLNGEGTPLVNFQGRLRTVTASECP